MTTPAGWYPDPEQPGQQRYWDGQQWAEHRAPTQPPAPPPPPGPPAATTAPQTHDATVDESSASSARNGKVVLLVIAVMIGVTAVAGIVSLFDDGSAGESTEPVATEPSTTPSPTAPEPKPEWDAGVLSTKVVNPATVRVTFLVMNKGDAPGRPVCTTRVRDFRSNDTWFEINTAKEPIKPGKIARFNVLVTVTNEGARYATYERVKCETA